MGWSREMCRVLATRRALVKFGDLPEAIAVKVQAIDTEAELDALLERVLRAKALDDMRL